MHLIKTNVPTWCLDEVKDVCVTPVEQYYRIRTGHAQL